MQTHAISELFDGGGLLITPTSGESLIDLDYDDVVRLFERRWSPGLSWVRDRPRPTDSVDRPFHRELLGGCPATCQSARAEDCSQRRLRSVCRTPAQRGQFRSGMAGIALVLLSRSADSRWTDDALRWPEALAQSFGGGSEPVSGRASAPTNWRSRCLNVSPGGA